MPIATSSQNLGPNRRGVTWAWQRLRGRDTIEQMRISQHPVRGGTPMQEHTIPTPARVWYDSPHASLCLLGTHLRHNGFFTPLETQVQIQQKAIKYTPVQKLEMLLVALLAGAKAVSHTGITLRVDPALYRAFGLRGCAEQSVIAATLDATTEADVVALREVLTELFRRYGQVQRHDFARKLLVLDVDLSPLP